MRVLGELIVILGAATAVMLYVMRRVISPALRRRNIARLEEENARLDRILDSDRKDDSK